MRRFTRCLTGVTALAALAIAGQVNAVTVETLLEEVEHGSVDNDGVKIHYVTLGEGPLVR